VSYSVSQSYVSCSDWHLSICKLCAILTHGLKNTALIDSYIVFTNKHETTTHKSQAYYVQFAHLMYAATDYIEGSY